MPQHSHHQPYEDTASSDGTSGAPAVIGSGSGQQNDGEERHFATQDPIVHESDGIHNDLRRIEQLNQRTREEIEMLTGQFDHQDRQLLDRQTEGDEDEPNHDKNTSIPPTSAPTIEEDSSDQGFLIQTIQRALDVAEPVEGELSMSEEQFLFSGSAEIDVYTDAADAEREGYTCADDITFDS
jgi:hypothetical protein